MGRGHLRTLHYFFALMARTRASDATIGVVSALKIVVSFVLLLPSHFHEKLSFTTLLLRQSRLLTLDDFLFRVTKAHPSWYPGTL